MVGTSVNVGEFGQPHTAAHDGLYRVAPLEAYQAILEPHVEDNLTTANNCTSPPINLIRRFE
jgi:hypothetical protein